MIGVNQYFLSPSPYFTHKKASFPSVDNLSLSELSDMFQNYLSLVSVINGCIGNGKRNPRIFAVPA
jgi:hypothetical protein